MTMLLPHNLARTLANDLTKLFPIDICRAPARFSRYGDYIKATNEEGHLQKHARIHVAQITYLHCDGLHQYEYTTLRSHSAASVTINTRLGLSRIVFGPLLCTGIIAIVTTQAFHHS